MKKLIKFSFLIGITILIGCTKDESTIDKLILMNYQFRHSMQYTVDGNNAIQKDTILYSFVDEEFVSATKCHFEPNENNVYELVKQETYSRKYIVDGDFIHFFTSTDLEVYDYLFSFHWKVKAMSREILSVDLYMNKLYKGSAELICIKKSDSLISPPEL